MRSYLITLFLILFSGLHASPSIIAHRGGGQNFPENTLFAFSKALEMGCDAIELDVQVTKDDVIVVYHPHDLGIRTNGSGTVSSMNWEEISLLDAGYTFQPENNFPYRGKGLRIPKLEDILESIPESLIIVDLKCADYEKLLTALADSISDEDAEHLIFYSTNREPIEWIYEHKPSWKTFEKREITRERLLKMNQGEEVAPPEPSAWIGFELKRVMTVKETFALGESTSTIGFRLWKPEVVAELKNSFIPPTLVLFGINSLEDWEEAVRLDVDAVYTDNPLRILK